MAADAKDYLRRIVAHELGVSLEQCKDDVLVSSLGADSLDMIELTMELEEHALTRPGDDAWMKCRTVGDFIHTALRGQQRVPAK